MKDSIQNYQIYLNQKLQELRIGKMAKENDWSVLFLFEIAKESNEKSVTDGAKCLIEFC